jgi:hypothetical protein
MLIHEHNSRHVHRGPIKGRQSVSSTTVKRATTNTGTTSILPSKSMRRKHFGATTKCQESCSWLTWTEWGHTMITSHANPMAPVSLVSLHIKMFRSWRWIFQQNQYFYLYVSCCICDELWWRIEQLFVLWCNCCSHALKYTILYNTECFGALYSNFWCIFLDALSTSSIKMLQSLNHHTRLSNSNSQRTYYSRRNYAHGKTNQKPHYFQIAPYLFLTEQIVQNLLPPTIKRPRAKRENRRL